MIRRSEGADWGDFGLLDWLWRFKDLSVAVLVGLLVKLGIFDGDCEQILVFRMKSQCVVITRWSLWPVLWGHWG
jgi:hypothetical protein